MKCSSCGFENREGAKFCLKCGKSLGLICPKCRKKLPSEALFCDECGYALIETKEAPPLDYSQPESYTPRFLADKILTTRSAIEGERKLVTVFFADVAGYTSLSEKLDPEEVHQIMDGCFKILMDEIHRFEGTINQFTGDGVMALFGAPLAHEDHALRACHAALSVQTALGDYGDKIKADTGLKFKMRIGLNSGPVIVGSIGDDLRMDYTAVGDTTNLADRMQGLATPDSVMVSSNTFRLASNYFEFESLGGVEVKGKEKTQEAYKLIKAGEIDTRIGASVSKGLTRFVGRQNSMAILNEAFQKSQSGSGQLVGIVGEAGVGKSRLLLEFINQQPKQEFTLLQGQCLHFGGSMAYLPLLDIIRSYFGINEGDPEETIIINIRDKSLSLDQKLSPIISPICELLSVKADDEEYQNLEPKEKKERTFEALRDLLIRVAQNQPLVIVVEDLHWMDSTTQEFLDYQIGWLANTRILIILLYRPEYSHQWGSKSYYTKIGLDQLGRESSMELLGAMLEKGEVVAELKNLILSRAAGNPLFMEEFTFSLLENGTIERKDEKYVIKGDFSDIQIPETVQGIIAARIDRLEDNLKRTMQVASVIGRDFGYKILHTITEMQEELKSYLLNLQGLEFIYEKQLFPELEYIFKHALIQEVAYDSLLHAKRKEIHQSIGQAIEDLYSDRLHEFYEVLAYHYSKTQILDKTYQYLKLSGQKASGIYNYKEALDFFNRAFEIFEELPVSEIQKVEQLELFSLMIRPMRDLMYPGNSLAILEQTAKLAEDLGNMKAQARCFQHLAIYHMFNGNAQLAMKYNEESYDRAQAINDVDTMALIGTALFPLYIVTGQPAKAFKSAPAVLELIEKTDRIFDKFESTTTPYFNIKSAYAASSFFLGHTRRAKSHYEEILPLAHKVEDLFVPGTIEESYGVILAETGNPEKAVIHIQNGIDCFEKGQIHWPLLNAFSYMGNALHHLGAFDKAKDYLSKASEIHRDFGDLPLSYFLYFYRFQIYLDENKLEKAKTSAQQIQKISDKSSDELGIGFSKLALGKIQGIEADKSSQFKAAEKRILNGVEILKEHSFKIYYPQGYLYLGELYADSGQKKPAMKYLKMAESLYQEMGFVYWLGRTREVLERVS